VNGAEGVSAGGGVAPAGEDLIIVARLGAPHGLRGELRLFPETDFPERLLAGRPVAVRGASGVPVWSALSRVRPLGGHLVAGLAGVRSREAAQAIVGATLSVAAADLPPLPEGRYYHHQVVGLAVVAADGRSLGRLAAIRQTGANDVYVVALADGGEALIPAIRDAVAAIDVAAGQLRLRDLPGLLDDGRTQGGGRHAD